MAGKRGKKGAAGGGEAGTTASPIEVAPAADLPPIRRNDPVVRRIGRTEVTEAFAAGLRDFQRAPLIGLFFGAVYALGGILVVWSFTRAGLSYLAYPLAAGFALIGPFAAVGLYEVSRRLEAGAPVYFRPVLGVIYDQGKREIGWMAFVMLFIFIVWMYQIRILLALFVGLRPPTNLGDFLTMLVTTPEGLLFLLVGNAIGAVLALAVFTLTVVSFPLLLDRDLDSVTAMITSVRAVTTSPKAMLGWGMVVVVALVIACLPAFLGLIVVLPVLGHTTWHLYRRAVAPAAKAPA